MPAGGALMIDDGFVAAPAPLAEARAEHYLMPGLIHAGYTTAITTILGSCVAVCVWDATRKTGGMSHFLLPHGSVTRGSEGRFAEQAIPRLLEDVVNAGARREHLQAKLFGGACVHAAFQRPDHLGVRNVESAQRLLAAAGIPVVVQDVLGTRGRKIVFHTDDGDAYVKYL